MEFNEETRLYYRFPVNNSRLCFVTRGGERLGTVRELSYGGFNVKLDSPELRAVDPKNPLKSNPYQLMELHFMGKMVKCLGEPVHVIQGNQGFRLVHEHTQVLLFLKEVLPLIRYGTALAYMEKNDIEDASTLPPQFTIDGQLPMELSVDGYDSNGIPNASVFIQYDKVTYQVARKNDTLQTFHNVWPGAESGQMRPTNGLDMNILRSGMAFLIGYSEADSNSPFGKLVEWITNFYQSAVDQSKNPPNKVAGTK